MIKNSGHKLLNMEMLRYKRELVIFLNMLINLKSNHIIKAAVVKIEKKQGKLICESDSSENPNIKKKNK